MPHLGHFALVTAPVVTGVAVTVVVVVTDMEVVVVKVNAVIVPAVKQ